MRDLTSAAWLTLAIMRRTLREGIVLRSLVVPGAIATIGTLIALIVITALRAPPTIAVTPATPDALVAQLQERDIEVHRVQDLDQAVRNGGYRVGIDGRSLWVDLRGGAPLAAEAEARRVLDMPWRPDTSRRAARMHVPPPEPAQRIVRLLGVLFCLYGVVFGAGGIARDRAEGLFDAELAAGMHHAWIGLARWFAAVVVISVPLAVAVAALHTVLWVDGALILTIHCVAGIAASVAVGMIVVGQAGLDRSFGSVLGYGLGAMASLVGLGQVDGLGLWVPVGSIAKANAASSPVEVVMVALGITAVGMVVFVRRVAVS